jgi:O-antigen biosynthesis protein
MVGRERSDESDDRNYPVRRRLLFVSHDLHWSGATIALAHLVGWLNGQGWDPLVVAPEQGPAAEIFRSYGVRTQIEPDLFADPDRTVLRSLVLRFDLVVANTIATFPAVQAAQMEHSPVLWYLHETHLGRQLIEQIPELRPALGGADALMTPTQATAEIYRPFTNRPIHVVPYGYPEPKARMSPSAHAFTFLTIASYEWRKGQDVLLEAICDLHSDLRWRALFQMAGRTVEKPFRDKLAEKSERIPNVQLLGPQTHEEAIELLSKADVLVCASRDQTMPIVLLEAMSLGKAIICTEVGGVHEWLRHDVNALLVPPEDPRAMAIALARCLADRELVRRLGMAGRQTFTEHFQLGTFGERFAKAAAETIAGARSKGTPGNYADWVELYETFGPADRVALRRQLDSLGQQPLISILLPVCNPDLSLLMHAIDSVKQQIYDRWELCIAGDASTEARVGALLRKAAAEDARIRLTLRKTNGDIAARSNSALDLAAGEWCALLQQEDMLAVHALAKVAIEIAAYPDAGLIYCDEDKVDLSGNRSHPFFKPDWNPELFLGQDYINGLAVYRMDLLRKLGGFREGFERSHDYDLGFRCTERLQADQIRHLPRVLYHRRIVSPSPPGKREGKLCVKETPRRVVAGHLQRMGIAGRAEACPENVELHRVIYELPEAAPRALIIVDSAGSVTAGQKCVESVRSLTTYAPYDIVVAADERRLYPEGLNHAGFQGNADILVFLQADLEATNRDWLRDLVGHANRPEVGAVGARLWYQDGTLQHSGYVLGLGEIAGLPHRRAPRGHPGFFNRTYLQRDCAAVSGACLATRKSVFVDIGGFDAKNLTSKYHDIDFCLRVREHGLRVIWSPYTDLVFRDRGAADDSEQVADERERHDAHYMRERWGDELRADPFYSPNLSLQLPGFELAFPPRWFGAA